MTLGLLGKPAAGAPVEGRRGETRKGGSPYNVFYKADLTTKDS